MKLELNVGEAFRHLFGPEGPWYRARNRLVPHAFPTVHPRFTIEENERVFCIGSCFARSLERYLANARFHIPTLDFAEPWEPELTEDNRLLNKAAPAGMYQEVEWAARLFKDHGTVEMEHCRDFMLNGPGDRIVDLRVARFSPVSEAEVLERRRSIYSVYAQLFTSGCAVIAPMQTQAWFDKEKESFIDIAPQIGSIFDSERFSFRVLDFGESLHFLDKTITLLHELNPSCKILLVVAPEPLFAAATGEDIITANLHGKSVLRAVCGELRQRYDFVDYLPFYEVSMMTKTWSVWESDRLHLRETFSERMYAAVLSPIMPFPEDIRRYQESKNLFNEGDIDGAIAAVSRALELVPGDLRFVLHFSSCLRAANRHHEAETALRQALQNGSADAALFGQLAALLLERGAVSEAIAMIRRAIELDPQTLNYSLTLVRALHQLGNTAEALPILDDMEQKLRSRIKARLQDVASYRQLARVLRLGKGRLDEAIDWLFKAIAISPADATLRAECGTMLMEADRSAEAETQLFTAVELKSKDPEIRRKLSSLFLRRKNFNEAVIQAKKALELKPDDPASIVQYANAVRMQGDLVEAEHIAKEGLKAGVEHAELYAILSTIAQAKGELNEAVGHAEKSATLQPGSFERLYRCAETLLSAGRTQDAERYLSEATGLCGLLPQRHMRLSALLFRAEQLERALGSARYALELDPENEEYRRNYEHLIADIKQRAEDNQAAAKAPTE